MASNSNMPATISRFDETQWVIQIRKTIDEELDEDTQIPVCIFNVPKTLLLSDPESYTPQQVPIGPYHYWRQEMYEMERYKLAAAKRMQKALETCKFEDVVQDLTKYEPRIRSCYHKYLTYNGETIAWMMAVDACFLLEFLQIYYERQGKLLHRISSRMSHLVDIAGRKSAHNAILRDLVMLENQIPLFILRRMLEIKFASLEMADSVIFSMLMGFAKAIAPFNKMEELSEKEAMESTHILDFLYHLMMPRIQRRPSEISELNSPHVDEEVNFRSPRPIKRLLDELWKIISKLNKGPVELMKKVLFSKALVFLTKLPWKIISNLPGIRILKGPMDSLFSVGKEKSAESENLSNSDRPPLIEEITIPSVTELSKACVKFEPTNGGIFSIRFDENSSTLYLPSINLDQNTGVVLRNIVAYEACNASGPVLFTRYTELMNGIIDTEDDARILREQGIIFNRLKTDEDVANLWNGMNRCVRLTKAPYLDKVIEDVNKYYNNMWYVKFRRFMKAYVFGSWQFLTLLACIMLLLLMVLQSFCSVYNCERFFDFDNDSVK
ncbi:hypothetical protein LIER_28505 [Lithospermum erythrorhizon]|uniref:Uncharacterized protein n=1 Tax=Lithospermum erythrorhizon TaxID=34254 RepID=A0AAV3RH36_LITER